MPLYRKHFVGGTAFGAALLLICGAALAGPGAEYLGPGCEDASPASWCEINRKQFLKWYPLALKGDYQSQRNVALCLFDGCDGAVIKNRITACAWRTLILVGGSMKVDSSDTSNMELCRKLLSSEEWLAVSGQVQTLTAKIRR